MLKVVLITAISTPFAIAADLEGAWHLLRPVIHAKDEQKAAAMRSASVVVLAEIQAVEVFGTPREVFKPPEVGGPMTMIIPLHLARISAKPLLNIRGNDKRQLEFYSWIWDSGKHGGPRLFHATPGSVHIFFLTQDSGYLHTVGDYPAYDLEIRSQWIQNFLAQWESGYGQSADLLERIVAVRLKAELESLEATEADHWDVEIWELTPLTTREFVTVELSKLCSDASNSIRGAMACAAYSHLVQR